MRTLTQVVTYSLFLGLPLIASAGQNSPRFQFPFFSKTVSMDCSGVDESLWGVHFYPDRVIKKVVDTVGWSDTHRCSKENFEHSGKMSDAGFYTLQPVNVYFYPTGEVSSVVHLNWGGQGKDKDVFEFQLNPRAGRVSLGTGLVGVIHFYPNGNIQSIRSQFATIYTKPNGEKMMFTTMNFSEDGEFLGVEPCKCEACDSWPPKGSGTCTNYAPGIL